MQISWQQQDGDVLCRWSDPGERVQYRAPWVEEAASYVDERAGYASGIDFNELSRFGGGEWYGFSLIRS